MPSPIDLLMESLHKHNALTALKIGKNYLSYQLLFDRARQLANCILEEVGRPFRIGILGDRSLSVYLGTLASLLLGVTFVPLHKNFSLERLGNILELTELDLIISDSRVLVERLIRNKQEQLINIIVLLDDEKLDFINARGQVFTRQFHNYEDRLIIEKISPKAIAYIMFTSGSTGTPKGVPISYGNLAHFIASNQGRYKISQRDRFAQTFDHTFDLSLFGIFLAWSSGACLYVMQQLDLLSPAYFVRENKITIWFSVPSVISLARKKIMLNENSMATLRLSLFCGEALSVKNIEAWMLAAPQSIIENLYGPTELTIVCSSYECQKEMPLESVELGVVPIGQIYPGHTIKIIDESGQEAMEGELCISGPQMFHGYLNDIKKTAEVIFAADKKIFYKTGDRVRFSKCGNLMYLGRLDNQIKVNGYRVELGEVEFCIKKYPGVIDAIVIGSEQVEGTYTSMAAFITGISQDAERVLLDFLAEALPAYMRPRTLFMLESLPLSISGKIDRNALKYLLNSRKKGCENE